MIVKNPIVPLSIAKKIVHDHMDYKREKKLSDWALCREVGVSCGTMQGWVNNGHIPRAKGLQKIIDSGASSMRLPDKARADAITATLVKIDDSNKIPRRYKKRIDIPDIVSNQLKLIIDDYISDLETPKTYNEFSVSRSDFINKMYYTCRQGE